MRQIRFVKFQENSIIYKNRGGFIVRMFSSGSFGNDVLSMPQVTRVSMYVYDHEGD